MSDVSGELPADQPPSWPYAPALPLPPAGLAKGAVAMAVALAVLQVGTTIAAFPASTEFVDAVDAGGSPLDVLTVYDSLTLVSVPALLVSYVVTCLWLWSARRFAEARHPDRPHQRGRIWAWLGWWVPIVSLWFPFQVVRDVRDAHTGRPQVSVGWWWAAWLAFLLLGRARDQIVTSPDRDTLASLPAFEVLVAVVMVVACVQWCRLVREISALQESDSPHASPASR